MVATDYDNAKDFYQHLGWPNYPDPPVTTTDDYYFERCENQIFDDGIGSNMYFSPFQNTNPIIAAHEKIWRGGHTNDILSLVLGRTEEGMSEEGISYLKGLLVSAITVLVVFIVWMVLLVSLKGIGRERVGFLSGRRAKLPPKPRGESEQVAEDDGSKNNANDDAPESSRQAVNEEQKENNGNVDEDVQPVSSEHDLVVDENGHDGEDTPQEKEKENPRAAILSDDEWNQLYATKKKEECWMKTAVLFACVIVICMACVMAQKGVQSLRGSLYDGQKTLNYAGTLLNEGADAVNEVADGLQSFQTEVLDLLERTNKGICPRLKPQGLCERMLEVDSCDFTIHIDLEKNITIDKLGVDKSIDVSYNYSVDVSEVADSIKDKIGLDGTLDLRQVLFPSAPQIYQEVIEFFSSNWGIIGKLERVADKINNIAAYANQTEEQAAMIEWVFYIAVVFDIVVGLLALCMIIHILAGDRMHKSLKCIQRRCLLPFFITCVSLAFIFAIAFLITSMVLSDTCVNDPNQRIMDIARYYLGEGAAADFILDFFKHWLSQCAREPPSALSDGDFYDKAQLELERFDSALRSFSESATDFCGTTDVNLFSDIIATGVKYICGTIGLSLDVRRVFECSTWMPLYYNTIYNAVCYNGIDGVWSIAATQFTTVLMACIILTYRAVFFDLEIDESYQSVSSSEDQTENKHENENEYDQ